MTTPAWHDSTSGGTAGREIGRWRTASYSGNGDNCVEVAVAPSGMLLRDTKDHGTGPVVAFSADQWAAFLRATATASTSANGAVSVEHDGTGTRVYAASTGVALRFTPGEWTAFRNGVRDGEFDGLTA